MNWKKYKQTQLDLAGIGSNFKIDIQKRLPNMSAEAQAIANATETALDELAKLVSQAMRSFVEENEN